ncbi:AfsR/SARP family transcriptional regulator [Streptomyces canus]|uniref:AfsR/SARP family transcriptional regulator n=1 Tax=Streptomyces canus TaxID=58343 RepID=UPI00277E3812|nr:AfsR/SARP family transcriptional regulator [Streptomyces canus]MDQ0762617.1 DNA-binding SARP family transcriptional activator [Streptomyces canus]MDQ1068939.1 DNA-binding SARP family transcriptional activator [Streptomyces canus]
MTTARITHGKRIGGRVLLMNFRLLGPFEILHEGRDITPTAPKLRAALALLLASHNRVVPTPALIEEIWSDDPPNGYTATVHTYIYQLRKLLHGNENTDCLVTTPIGYRADIAPEALDLCEFERLSLSGRQAFEAGDMTRASQLLHEALVLRRGGVLTGVRRGPLLEAQAARLEENLLRALLLRIDADLRLGRHGELVGELRELVIEYPMHEELNAKLMLALYRCDRRSAALQVYHDVRHALRDELGIVPSPNLQRIHQDILMDAPVLQRREAEPVREQVTVTASVPATLPPDIGDFVGREAELGALDRLLTPGDTAPRTVLVVGAPGAGKRALARRAAHRARHRFPDGQLYASLVREGGRDAEPAEILGEFLRVVGFDPADIPVGEEERSSMFRSWAADRGGLLVLEGASDLGRLRPLMPSGPEWAVLVTGEYCLPGLASAQRLELGPLDPAEGLELLTAIVGRERIAREPDAADELVRFCGGLPLALRAAGERLVSARHWSIRKLLRRASDPVSGLEELRVGDIDLAARYTRCYLSLSEPERAAFRVLGRLGTAPFNDERASRELQVDARTTEDLLDALVQAHLVEVELAGPDGAAHYRFSGLLARFAGSLATYWESLVQKDLPVGVAA